MAAAANSIDTCFLLKYAPRNVLELREQDCCLIHQTQASIGRSIGYQERIIQGGAIVNSSNNLWGAKMKLRLHFSLVLGLYLLAIGVNAQEPATAHDVVRETTSQVMVVVQEAPSYVDDDPERYYQQIQVILDDVVDFRGFARGVMGPYATSERYRSLDEAGREQLRAQLDRFTEVMRTGMVRTYGKGLLAFGGASIEISKPSLDEAQQSRVSVEQLIFSDDAQSYVVMYQMGRSKSGAWQLRNMIIESINLGEIYRNQFKAAARKENGAIDAVIAQWAAVEIDE
jgi:phospholipid transport system substrate-binding protein